MNTTNKTKLSDSVCGEFLAPNESVTIQKPDMHPIDRLLRIYCVQFKSSWKLQVRGPLGVGRFGTTPSKTTSIIAGVDLSRQQMIDLRDAIDELLAGE